MVPARNCGLFPVRQIWYAAALRSQWGSLKPFKPVRSQHCELMGKILFDRRVPKNHRLAGW